MPTFRSLAVRPVWRRLAWVGCLGLLGTIAAGQDLAGVRFVHLSPDAPEVDVVVGDGALHRDVGYGGSTAYAATPAGERTIRVYPHRLPTTNREGDANGADGADGGEDEGEGEGERDGDEEAAPVRLEPITRVVTLQAGEYYTVVLSGFYEPPPEEGQRGAISIDVEPAEADVVLQGPRGYVEEFSGDRLLEDLEEGEYELEVAAEGFQPYRQQVTVQPFRTVVIAATLQEQDGANAQGGDGESGEEAADPVGGADADDDGAPGGGQGAWDPAELHVFEDGGLAVPAPGHARVAVLHASPLAPTVDVTFIPEDEDDDGAEPVLMALRLGYPNGSELLDVPAGRGTLRITVADSDNRLAEIPRLTLRAGVGYEFFLASDPDDESLWVVPTVAGLLRHAQ